MNSARLVMSLVTKLLVLGICGFGLRILGHAFAAVPVAAEPVARAATSEAPFSGHGRILNAEGLPVAGANVRARDAEGRVIERALTRPDGGFQLVQKLERFRLEIDHPTHGRTQSAWLQAQSLVGAGADPLTLVLESPIDWPGSVVDAEGAPIAEAQIHAVATPCVDPCEATWASADPRGRFSLRVSSPGAYQVTAWARGFAPRQLVLELANDAAAERITLTPHAPLRGVVVTPEGHLIAEATVRVCDDEHAVELTSASDGSFLLAADSVGCNVVAHHPRFAHSPAVRVRAGRRVTLQLGVGGSIEGIATDPSGYPLRDLSVELSDYTPADDEAYFPIERFGSSTTIARSFRIDSLAPGTYAAKITRRADSDEESTTEAELREISVLAGRVTRGIQIIVPNS